jgi:hypothetical protein
VKARNVCAVQSLCFRRDLLCLQSEPHLRASHIVILSSQRTGDKMRNLNFFAFLRQLTCRQEFAKSNVNNIVVKPGLALTTRVQEEWEQCNSGGSLIFALCVEQDFLAQVVLAFTDRLVTLSSASKFSAKDSLIRDLIGLWLPTLNRAQPYSSSIHCNLYSEVHELPPLTASPNPSRTKPIYIAPSIIFPPTRPSKLQSSPSLWHQNPHPFIQPVIKPS